MKLLLKSVLGVLTVSAANILLYPDKSPLKLLLESLISVGVLTAVLYTVFKQRK
ncbi:hypothetical protein [Neisseria chenwenguii]|uniref:hypothetical protein n=1 Tax=Neisseria chenwenguii TaxID=1853278 RepID=UPI0012FE0D24|nr:hypothetical protein [Neisseria chenwenguii]